jgi:outer membrane protein assembly factor BamB
MALNAADGAVLWEAAVAPARGRTELERLVDIDSAVRVIDNDIYVVGFQGRAAMLAIDSGQVWWSRELSSSRGLDVDAEDVVVSTSDGDVVSLKRRTGVEVWRQDALKRRNLSPPALVGAAVAVADFDGYVHWLDRSTGAMLARTRVGSRVSNAPLVANGLMVLIDDQGKLAAFRPRFAAPEAAAPPVVPADSSAAEVPPASGS